MVGLRIRDYMFTVLRYILWVQEPGYLGTTGYCNTLTLGRSLMFWNFYVPLRYTPFVSFTPLRPVDSGTSTWQRPRLLPLRLGSGRLWCHSLGQSGTLRPSLLGAGWCLAPMWVHTAALHEWAGSGDGRPLYRCGWMRQKEWSTSKETPAPAWRSTCKAALWPNPWWAGLHPPPPPQVCREIGGGATLQWSRSAHPCRLLPRRHCGRGRWLHQACSVLRGLYTFCSFLSPWVLSTVSLFL